MNRSDIFKKDAKRYFGYISSLGLSLLVFLFLIIPVGLKADQTNGCDAPAFFTLMINPTITGPDTACAGNGGYVYTTEPGMTNYDWSVSLGGTITSGQGTYSITVTWNSAGPQTVSINYYSAPAPAVMNVTVLPVLPVGISISASANPSCSGSPVIFTASPVNGGTSPVYQWMVNNVPVGTNSPTYTYSPSNGNIVACQLTSNASCISGNPATSNQITMTVDQPLPVSVSISASANPVCQGASVTYTAAGTNGGSSPSYQWKVNGNNQGLDSPSFIYFPNNGDVVTCVMTSNAGCTSGNPATSNSVTMSVSPLQPVSVSITASSNPACQGNNVTFTATPVNGGFSPAYEWKVNGVVSGSNSPVFSYVPADGDQVTCKLTSSVSCSSGNPATSNTITMTVNPYLPVSIAISASANPVCQGSQVTMTAIATNGGSSPVYQWMINGFPVGTNTMTFTFVPANGDVVTCQLFSNITCPSGNPAISNQVTMTVNPVLPTGVSIAASSNPVCEGVPVTITATPFNGGSSPSYQWKVNGANVGTNTSAYSYIPSNGDVVTCVMTSSASCAYGNPATSNSITIIVSPNQQANVTITASSNPVCENTQVTFAATAVNGGSSPSYQWKVNGINSGTNNPIFAYIPVDNDVVTCVMTSTATCVSNNPAISNPIIMDVLQSQNTPVSVTITPSSNPSCMGQTVTYTATPVNGGASPSYQWMVNGLNVGTDSPTFSYIPTNGDFVKCILTSSITCATGNPATSNQINMTVNPNLTVSVSISVSANPSCQGAQVTFTATAVNAGSSPVYQWKVNGANVGTNQATYSYIPVNGNVVTCQLTSSVSCPITNPVTSNAITMNVQPILPVTISISTLTNPSCIGSSVTFTATISNGGTNPQYQWKLNGTNTGPNSPILSLIPIDGDAISCQLTSNAVCFTGSKIVLSNTINMAVHNSIIPAITITTSSNPFCEGNPVTFTATPTNGGNTPAYQWKVNCVNVGTNSPAYTYTPADGDFITCQMTSSLSCAIQNPTISNAITLKKNTDTQVSVVISASNNPVCQGSSVTFTAVPVNGGANPTYQWKVNGINAGTNSPTFSYIPTNNDVISCILTSSISCASGNPATSNAVTMTTSTGIPVSVSIATFTNPFCTGTAVTFTATPVNGGPSPSYQWKVNGSNSGTNSSSYTYLPLNGDIVTCELTSNSACASGTNPFMSNQIIMAGSSSIPVSISISAASSNVCQGATMTYSATAVNGGNSPVFQWKVNGVNTGPNQPVFSYTPVNADVITCQLTSDLACASGSPAMSNPITMVVNPVLPVSVNITASCNPCCEGTPVTFNASVVNAGPSPVYQWKVNCMNVGTNNSTYTYTPVNGDVVVCMVTSSETCRSNNPATSNNINMIVQPILPVSVSITASANPFCIGDQVTFIASGSYGGTSPVYQWKVNGINMGSNNPEFTYNPAVGDVVECSLTSSFTCVTGNPALSNQIIMTGVTALPVTISITASSNPVCQGTQVSFAATIANGGASPVYQWKVNDVNVGTNNQVYTYIPANGDVVICQLTTSLSCATPNPALSNPVTMTVFPKLPVSIIISTTNNPSCEGETVCFTSTITNGGSSPSYSWWKNGSYISGTNSPTYCYVPQNGDVIYCRVVSNVICATGNPAFSNNITMTVNPYIPASVSITASANPICQGAAVTFTAVPVNGGTSPTYQWKVNGINSGTNNPTFTYNPVNGDVVYCEMNSNSPCATVTFVTSNNITMTVSPIQPVGITISASSNPTCIGNTVTFTATPVNGGTMPSYQWKVNGIATGPDSPVYSYVPLNGDVITCTLTSNATCTSGNPATSSTITMNVSSGLPVSISIAGSSDSICSGQMVTFTAVPGNGGQNPIYRWMVNGINVGSNSPAYTYSPTNGDLVKCQLTSSFSCATGNPAISNQISEVVSPYLPVNVYITGTGNPVCEGTSVTYTAFAFNGGSAPVYQWKVNGINVGTNSSTYSYVPVNTDSVTCEVTSSETCPINNPAMSNLIIMNVLQVTSPSISISASTNPSCVGSPVTFTATVTNGGSFPGYQWKVNGVTVGGSSSEYTYIPANDDTVTCVLTSNAPCMIVNTVVSNQLVMNVSSDLPVNLNISASSNPACLGQTVTFTATPANGGTNPVYQWMVNGFNVGSNSPLYSYTPTEGDSVRCQMSSDLSCATGNPALSNKIDMQVNSNLPVSVFITASVNPVCLGSPVTFTATPANEGSSPTFQWKVNGMDVGANIPSYTYVPSNGDIVTCQLISSLVCASGNPAISNQIVMVVSTDLAAGVTITASANPVCTGIPVTFTATGSNGGSSPVYQWKVNGNTVGTNSTTYTYLPGNGDVVNCTMTSNLTCATGSPANSNAIVMSVTSGVPASVSVTADPSGSVCEGTTVTFTANPINGGSSPQYQWFRNGSTVGLNQPTYSSVPVNGDLVYVVMTSNMVCVSGNPATSNTITMTVDPSLPVSITIAASDNPVCAGTAVTYTATPVNGGSSPSYQWKVNGNNSGTNSPVFNHTPVDGDVVTCVLTSNAVCPTGNPAASNAITMTVNPLLPVSITIAASDNPVCAGTVVTYTATPVNGGSSPSYQWKVNGNNSGTNSPFFTYIPVDGDVVTCVLTSNAVCPTGNPATSNAIAMIVNPLLPVSVTIVASANPVCAGSAVTYTATPVNGGSSPSYQWKVNGNNSGTNSPVFNHTPVDGDVVTCVLTSNAVCPTGNPAASNAVTMTVNPLLPVSITIAASDNPVCAGTAVTYTATPVNGGSSPSYQWKVNGNNSGTNSPVFTYIPVDGDVVTCVLTSNAVCNTGSPATSNTITMTVNPLLPVSVTITVDQNNICEGTSVTFTATPVNGGSSPVYQWYLNSVPVGSNQPTYTCTPNNNEVIYVIMTSSLPCVTGNPAMSNTISMVVFPLLPVSVSISADQNDICEGTSVTFTAVPVNGGTSPSYIWYHNAVPAGSNQPTYTCVPADGDQVYVVMMSSLTCVTGNPAISNIVSMTVYPIPGAPIISMNGMLLESNAPAGNQWYFQGNLIPGATAQTYYPSLTGWYWDVVTLEGCSSDTSNNIYVLIVGAEEKPEISSLKVFPVPNDGTFTILISGYPRDPFTIGIYNYLGQKVYELNDVMVNARFERMVDLRPVASGIYSVVFRNNDRMVVKWIMVNNK